MNLSTLWSLVIQAHNEVNLDLVMLSSRSIACLDLHFASFRSVADRRVELAPSSLTALRLDRCVFFENSAHQWAVCLSKMPSLTALRMEGTHIPPKSVSTLFSSRSLTSLSVSSIGKGKMNWKSLESNNALTELILTELSFGDRDVLSLLASVKKVPHLTALNISDWLGTRDSVSIAKQFLSIRHLRCIHFSLPPPLEDEVVARNCDDDISRDALELLRERNLVNWTRFVLARRVGVSRAWTDASAESLFWHDLFPSGGFYISQGAREIVSIASFIGPVCPAYESGVPL